MSQDELKQRLQRIIRNTRPDNAFPVLRGERRKRCRHNRVLPALVIPLRENGPGVDEADFGLSGDLSDGGIGIFMQHRLQADRVVVGLCEPLHDGNVSPHHRPVFLSGSLRETDSVGGRFWQLCIEFDGLYDDSRFLAELETLARDLLPAEASCEAPAPALGTCDAGTSVRL